MSRPCTERQASYLAERGFNPDNFDFDAASRKIDEIIQANPRPGGQRQGGYQRSSDGNNYQQRNNFGNGGNGNARGPQGGGRAYGGRNNGNAQGNYRNNNQARSPRDPNAPATPRQQEILAEYGYDPNISISQASDIIGALKENNWEPLNNAASPFAESQVGGRPGGPVDPNELPWS